MRDQPVPTNVSFNVVKKGCGSSSLPGEHTGQLVFYRKGQPILYKKHVGGKCYCKTQRTTMLHLARLKKYRSIDLLQKKDGYTSQHKMLHLLVSKPKSTTNDAKMPRKSCWRKAWLYASSSLISSPASAVPPARVVVVPPLPAMV